MTELQVVKTIADRERLLSLADEADQELTARFATRLQVNAELDRKLVSYQANKEVREHRWCKYREGYSAELNRYILDRNSVKQGMVLDPFAGSGTTLFVASDRGLNAVGIELLPSSAEIIEVRQSIAGSDGRHLVKHLRRFLSRRSWQSEGPRSQFSHVRITEGAFPNDTQRQLERYMSDAKRVPNPVVRRVLRFAAMCILESVSYTRKDGQFLRWDKRSGRRAGKNKFQKGLIHGFTEAIEAKLQEMIADLEANGSHSSSSRSVGTIEFIPGSCLDELPRLPDATFDALITSPPYCNRYDYTRTYALELAFLGVGEDGIRSLRQKMLSCTVENREKQSLASQYQNEVYQKALEAFDSQRCLQAILRYLDYCRDAGQLNNAGIARMVRNYFWESCLLIFEAARVLKSGAPFVMVNDNVRYKGAHIPVDLILSDFAEHAGYTLDKIWVLPRGKGNSSQQMAAHGRKELRKCVYVWHKA